MLELARGAAEWRPYRWTFRRAAVPVDQRVLSANTRPRHARSDWNIKSSGVHKPDGLLPSSGFTVLVCTTETGWFELAVPTLDVPLVASFINQNNR